MIITLTGENSFRVGAELQGLTRRFLDEYGDVALERLDGETASFDRLQEALSSLPFLASKKMVVLRAPSANKQFTEKAEEMLRAVPETTDVIIVEPKLDKRLSYFKFLKKATDFRECNELDENGLARWLTETAKDKGGSISLADARFLVERIGQEQQLVGSELEKLLLYNPTVTHADIELLTEAAPQSSIFELLEAAFAQDAKRTLALYSDQRAQKVDPAQIIAMLSWQLRILALIKLAGERSIDAIAKEAKLNPFVVRKSQGIAHHLSLVRLKRLITDLLAIDTRSKRENIDLDEALQHYLLTLAANKLE
jgi:DNA polymerase-3 subunit delta